MNGSPDLSGAIEAIATVATAILALAALFVAVRANRTSKTAFLADVRAYWESLADDWAVTRLFVNTYTDYYSDADLAQRTRVSAVIATVNGSADLTERVTLVRSESRHPRRVARFFSYVVDGLIRGRLAMDDVYALFGPEVARHFNTIVWLAARPRKWCAQLDPPSEWDELTSQLIEPAFRDEGDTIELFAHLMAAEQANRGDTHPHLIMDYAKELDGEGALESVQHMLRRACAARGRPTSYWRLIRTVSRATRPYFRVVFRPGVGSLTDSKFDRLVAPSAGFDWITRVRIGRTRRRWAMHASVPEMSKPQPMYWWI